MRKKNVIKRFNTAAKSVLPSASSALAVEHKRDSKSKMIIDNDYERSIPHLQNCAALLLLHSG